MLRFLVITTAKAESDGRARIGRRLRSATRTAFVRSGAWSIQVTLPSTDWRTATVTASTPGSSWYKPGTSVRVVRRG